MSLLFTLVKGMFAGVVLFYAIPMATKPLEWEQKEGILDFYMSMSMSALGRALLIERSHGLMSYVLKRSRLDAAVTGEMVKLGGEVKRWRDPENLMTSLYGRPFGLAHEDRDTIVDARMCHLGKQYKKLKRSGEWTYEADGEQLRKAYFEMTEGTHLVRINDVLPIVQTRAPPSLTERLEVYVEKGQSMFDDVTPLEMLPWLAGLGAGTGLMWMASKAAESTSGGDVTLPLQAGMGLLGVGL